MSETHKKAKSYNEIRDEADLAKEGLKVARSVLYLMGDLSRYASFAKLFRNTHTLQNMLGPVKTLWDVADFAADAGEAAFSSKYKTIGERLELVSISAFFMVTNLLSFGLTGCAAAVVEDIYKAYMAHSRHRFEKMTRSLLKIPLDTVTFLTILAAVLAPPHLVVYSILFLLTSLGRMQLKRLKHSCNGRNTLELLGIELVPFIESFTESTDEPSDTEIVSPPITESFMTVCSALASLAVLNPDTPLAPHPQEEAASQRRHSGNAYFEKTSRQKPQFDRKTYDSDDEISQEETQALPPPRPSQ